MRTEERTRTQSAVRQRSCGCQSTHVHAGLWSRESEQHGTEGLPLTPHCPEMPRRLAPSNTTTREVHSPQPQPRTSTDPAPLCLKGS
eukprot:544713-Pyramimonas_sp.AAC.1